TPTARPRSRRLSPASSLASIMRRPTFGRARFGTSVQDRDPATHAHRRGRARCEGGMRGSRSVPSMRLVIARCTVDYEGRLTARLRGAIRLGMVKAEGCVAIHADGGAYKPLNWMVAPNVLVEA